MLLYHKNALNSQTYFRNDSTTTGSIYVELSTVAANSLLRAQGHGRGLGAERRVQWIFHASLTHHNRGLVLAGTNGTIPPTQGANGDANGHAAPIRRDLGGSVLVSHALGGLHEGILGGWTQRVGPSGTSHYLGFKTDLLFFLSRWKMSPLDPENKKQEIFI